MNKTQKGYVIYCKNSKQHYWCTSKLPIRAFEELLINEITWPVAKRLCPKILQESWNL